jgi:hypothetical protein
MRHSATDRPDRRSGDPDKHCNVLHTPIGHPSVTHGTTSNQLHQLMSYTEEPHEIVLVPLDRPEGWLISNFYAYATGKMRKRSCCACRLKKLNCPTISNQVQCDRCAESGVDCRYSLTDAESQKLKKLELALGEKDARRVSGLKEMDAVGKFIVEHPQYAPSANAVFNVPTLLLQCHMAEQYFAHSGMIHLINPWIFEKWWLQVPMLISAVAMMGLTSYTNMDTSDMVDHAKNLFAQVERWILQNHECDEFVKMTILAYYHMNSGLLHGSHDHLAELTMTVATEYINKCFHSQASWLFQQPDASFADLMQIDCMRRVFWGIGSEIKQMHWGILLPNFAWQVRRRIPFFSSDLFFRNARNEYPRECFPDVFVPVEEWKDVYTLGWLSMKRCDRRSEIIRRVCDLQTFGPWNWTYLCVAICYRACRGDPSLWSDVYEHDILDQEGDVDLKTWYSAKHWDDLLDDIWAALPLELQEAHAEARGDLLYHWGLTWWGQSCALRLLIGCELLREARASVMIRSLRCRGEFTLDSYVADALIGNDTSDDSNLLALLNEVMLLTKSFMKAAEADPKLHGISVASLSPLLRAGYLHLAIAKRLLKLNQPPPLVLAAMDDCLTTVKLMRAISNNASHIAAQIVNFEKFLTREEEPKIGELTNTPLGGLGFWNLLKIIPMDG